MPGKILFVDDDRNILSAFQRTLRGRFHIETTDSAAKAFQILELDPDFAVIVSDYRMPTMNGVEFLAQAAVRWPDCVRVLLTGEADTRAAAGAVNQGQIFRFLLKPCAPFILEKTLNAALKHHRWLNGEKSLLEQTLRASMELLVDLLEQAHPNSFPHSRALYGIMQELLADLPLEDKWEFELASLLSEIGNISLPPGLLEKADAGIPLSAADRMRFASRTAFAERLLATIPRLDFVARVVGAQDQPLPPLPSWQQLDDIDRFHLGTNLLSLVARWQVFRGKGLPHSAFLVEARALGFSLPLVKAAECLKLPPQLSDTHMVRTSDLEQGMALDSDLVSDSGVLLLTKGQTLSPLIVDCLHRRAHDYGVDEEVLAHAPRSPVESDVTDEPPQ